MGFVNGQNRLDRFDFNDYFVFDEKIDSVPQFDHDTVVFDRESFFDFEGHTQPF